MDGFYNKFKLAVDLLMLKYCCKLHADVHTLILCVIYTWLCSTLSTQTSITLLLFMFSTLARCRYSCRIRK